MLIEFSVENFRSFGKKNKFHLVSGNFKRFKNHIHTVNNELGILKTTAIYGSNGSGKTNLFRAMYFVKKMVSEIDFLNSIESKKLLKPFLLKNATKNNISSFELSFLHKDIIFSYLLKVDDSTIHEEKLSYFNTDGIILDVFIRNNKDKGVNISFPNNEEYKEYATIVGTVLLKSHQAFLSTSFIPEFSIIDNARVWFKEKVEFLFPVYKFMDIAYILSKKPEYLNLANRIIKFSEIGIDKLEIKKFPIHLYLGSEKKELIDFISKKLEVDEHYPFQDSEGAECTAVKEINNKISILKLVTIHIDDQGNEVAFDLDQESRGTIVLLNLIPALILSYGEGVNYFIDEINRSLHPILIRELFEQYLTHNISNAKGQLIFNSHEDFMMDEEFVRQDELWLMEKNETGESDLFPLSDYKNIRYDLKYSKNYLQGKFGGVPFTKQPAKLDFANG